MNVTVFGATGATGQHILRQALAAGHQVTAVARRPAAVQASDPRLRVVAGDVLRPASLAPAITGAEVVVSALGSRAMREPTTVYSAGTAAVLEAMHEAGVRRFLTITAATLNPTPAPGFLDRYLLHPLLWRIFRPLYQDMHRMETLLLASDRDWTIFRPPRLTNTTATGRYRIAVDAPLPHAWTLSRADLAAAMLAGAHDPALIRHTVTIAA